MKNPTPATTAADTPGSSERLKDSADVGGREMKGGAEEGGEEGVSDSQSLTAFAPASAAKKTKKKQHSHS